MFADTLDAITTDRPYRKALGIEEAHTPVSFGSEESNSILKYAMQ